MKRTCNGCKALDYVGLQHCQLGYKNEVSEKWRMDADCREDIHSIIMCYKPLEECPKPTNNKRLMNDYMLNKKEC